MSRPRKVRYPRKVGTCANQDCGREKIVIMGRGWCTACYSRWRYWGRPESGPPPPSRFHDIEGRLEDFDFLVSMGVTSATELASRIGVAKSTITRYRKIRGLN